MDAILGMLGLIVFGACVILFAAATTWLVVKISPTK
jgi:hypothetical protein